MFGLKTYKLKKLGDDVFVEQRLEYLFKRYIVQVTKEALEDYIIKANTD